MRKAILLLKFLAFILTSAVPFPIETDIPASARMTIQEDYLEWIHPPRRAGPCEELPVVKLEWIKPHGVDGKRPVVWLKAEDKFAAILGLTDAQAEWLNGRVSAQPLMVLRDVSIYRLCSHESQVTPW
jgi:hypothetical protein